MRLLLPGNCEFCTNPCDFFCSVLDCYARAWNGRTQVCLRWGVRCMHVTQLKKKSFFLSSSFIQGETLFDYDALNVDTFQRW